MSRLFFAVHKNGVAQTNIAPAESYPTTAFIDPLLTFTHAKRNDELNGAPLFDLSKSRVQVPGYYFGTLSINVANPTAGGKYYALVNRNNQPNVGSSTDFELLRPNRMAGSGDTVGTSVSGFFNIRAGTETRLPDFATARIQISNVPSANRYSLGGIHYETYWHAERLGDPIEDTFPERAIPPANLVKTAGNPTSVAYATGNFTYADLSYNIPAGTNVKSLMMHASQSGAYKLMILKRTSATIFDVVTSIDIFHAAEGDGWDSFPITPVTIPTDLNTYHVAAFTNGQVMKLFDMKPRGCKSAPAASGTGNNLAVTSPAISGYYVVGTGYGY